jgi:hypothetical protein
MGKRKVIFFDAGLFVLCCLLLCGCTKDKPSFNTEYQAVLLDNGQAFFGKIENADGEYPVLRDVFYIGRQASPDGKDVKNILIKRGNEWHTPEYMHINKKHIVMIEPVSPASTVAQLIKEAKSGQDQQHQTVEPKLPEGTGKQ